MKKTRIDKTPEMDRLRENLFLIRSSLGWSSEDLGEYVGLSRQTINNLEKGATEITKTQYYAIRFVLTMEMADSPNDTDILKTILEMFVDNPDDYSENDKKKVREMINIITPSISKGTASREAASQTLVTMTSAIAGGALIAAISALSSPKLVGSVLEWGLETFLKDKK